jgi:hypothetical protein
MNRRWRLIAGIVAALRMHRPELHLPTQGVCMSRSRAFSIVCCAAILVGGITYIVHTYHTWQHWLAYATGSFNVSGVAHNYNFFSGSGSDISELGIFSALAVILYHACRHGNCHMHGCWRIGGYPVGDFKVCRKHHAESTGVKHVDIERLKLAHHLHMRSKLINAGFSAGDDNGTPPSPTA